MPIIATKGFPFVWGIDSEGLYYLWGCEQERRSVTWAKLRRYARRRGVEKELLNQVSGDPRDVFWRK